MVKKSLLVAFMALVASAQIVVEKVRQEQVGRIYHASAEVVELSSIRQEVVLPVDAVIERYLVKEGQKVAKKQKIAIARSKTVTTWSSRYIAKKRSWSHCTDATIKLQNCIKSILLRSNGSKLSEPSWQTLKVV